MVTGVPVVTADGSSFELTWSITKHDVSCILCDDDCEVIIWVKTLSSIAFSDFFGSCEYTGLYSSRSVASIFTRLFTLLCHNFMIWLCICVNTCIFCCQKYMVNKIQVHRRPNNAFHPKRVVDCFAFGRQLHCSF